MATGGATGTQKGMRQTVLLGAASATPPIYKHSPAHRHQRRLRRQLQSRGLLGYSRTGATFITTPSDNAYGLSPNPLPTPCWPRQALSSFPRLLIAACQALCVMTTSVPRPLLWRAGSWATLALVPLSLRPRATTPMDPPPTTPRQVASSWMASHVQVGVKKERLISI